MVLAAEEGFRVEEQKVPLYDRRWGSTKFSIWRIPVGVLDLLAVKFQITFLKKPLLFFGVAGSMLFVLGVLIGFWALYLRFVQGHGDRVWLYLVILLVGVGMALFMLGFLSEGMTAIREEIGDLRKKTTQLLKRQDEENET